MSSKPKVLFWISAFFAHYALAYYLQSKLDAYACYKKEVRPGDHPRSLDSLKTLAKFRGNSVGRPYAEAFVVIRHISND